MMTERDCCEDWAIREDQHAALSGLVCERISRASQKNGEILRAFEPRTPDDDDNANGVLEHFKSKGCAEDDHRENAVYIVKTRDDVGLLAFSLKCGELFEPFITRKIDFIRQVLSNCGVYDAPPFPKGKPTFRRATLRKLKVKFLKTLLLFLPTEIIGRIPAFRTFPILDIQFRMRKWPPKDLEKKRDTYTVDKRRERNLRNARVYKTESGILLVDFCRNYSEAAKAAWAGLGLGEDKPMGKTLFWWFIMPVISQVQNTVGCERCYLFAADTSEDGSLMAYYRDLGFRTELLLGANKPYYDLNCPLMSQRVSVLERLRNRYFQSFNFHEDLEE